jgi:hypothetical protein
MDPEHEAHLDTIKTQITELIDTKYRAGQKEHGGTLWQKPGLLDEAIKEVVDLAVYLLTLKEQISDLKIQYNVDQIATDYAKTFEALKDK